MKKFVVSTAYVGSHPIEISINITTANNDFDALKFVMYDFWTDWSAAGGAEDMELFREWLYSQNDFTVETLEIQ